MIGKKILNYEIKTLLGEGGMGNVYLAEHTQLGRRVAIKSLHQQLVKNEGLRIRFKNEASTMAHLQHSKIVALYDYVEEPDGLYLIMEYVDGLPLDEYIRSKSGPIPFEKAIPMMRQILDAFYYAHSKGIVHRDIKPSNILIDKNGEIKILDFGIAKMLNDGSGHKLTKTGTQMGTVYYMSPEQVQGKDIDIRSDIYSLGVTFFQMLTGSCPYDGLTTEFEVYSKIVSEPLPLASKLYPGVPEFLDQVILKSTQKNRDERFKDCEDFSKNLDNKSFKVISKEKKVQIPSPEELTPSTPDFQSTQQKSPLKLIAMIIAALMVIGGVYLLVTKDKDDESDSEYYIDESSNESTTESEAADPAAESPTTVPEATATPEATTTPEAYPTPAESAESPRAKSLPKKSARAHEYDYPSSYDEDDFYIDTISRKYKGKK